MPIVGRLETIGTAIRPSCSLRAARHRAIGQDLVLGQQRAVDIGNDEGDTGHEAASFNWWIMSSTIGSTGASIDTVIGRSTDRAAPVSLNWLASKPRRHEVSFPGGEPGHDDH